MPNESKMQYYQEAAKSFTEAIRMRPGFAMSYIFRGEVYHKMGKYDLAITDFTDAILQIDLLLDFLRPVVCSQTEVSEFHTEFHL